jgi:threonine/homoserine/homoserine lactone efflux protein
MIPLHSMLIYLGIYAAVIAIPGPNVIAITARALAGGFRAAVPASFGTALGDIVLMSVSALGLSAIARAPDALFLAVKIAGVLYLAWIGFRYWHASDRRSDDSRQSRHGPPSEKRAGAENSVNGWDVRRGFLAQLAVTAGNPKGIAFFFAVLPNAIDLRHLAFTGYLELVAATSMLIPAITLSYAAAASRARHLLASRKAQRRLNRGAGIAMIGAALSIAVSG